MTNHAPRLSVSTWSLHRALGVTFPDAPGQERVTEPVPAYGAGAIALMEVPERIAQLGIHALEICHFHLPSLQHEYLDSLRGALDAAGVELFSVLIDEGNITHPEHGTRDLQWIGAWIDVAGALGARCVRVIAGKSNPTEENLQTSIAGFRTLVARAQPLGVRVMTENWFSLLSRPEHVLRLLDSLDGTVGLCFDFGNWGGPTKYEDLAAIAARAESCHTKGHFTAPGVLDTRDYIQCLDITRNAGFTGPYTLIYDGPGDDEWDGLMTEREVVRPYLQAV